MKKTASILLAALLILSFIPSALAEESGDAAEAPEPITQETIAEEQDIAEEEKEPAPDAPETEELAETAAEPAEEEPEDLPVRDAGSSTKASKVRINATNFPDPFVRDYVSSQFDKDGDGYLSTAEADAVTVFDVSHDAYDSVSGDVESLKGAEHFRNLKELYCGHNRIRELDLSAFPQLETLNCWRNQIGQLDLSGCPKLDVLYCDINELTELDISGCPTLLSYYTTGSVFLMVKGLHVPNDIWNVTNENFNCKIEFDVGVKLLTGLDPVYPVITKQPQDVNATAGKKVTLSVTASGEYLNYQWQVSKDGGKTWNDCTDDHAKSATFSFTFKAGYAGWKYRCLVYERLDCLASSAATLYTSPTVSKQPTYVQVTQGEKAVFQVTAAGGGLTYQWQVSKDDGKTWKNCSSTGYNTRKLSFTAKYTYGGWMYRCVIKNPAGTVTTDSALLMVLPTVSEVSGQTVLAGEKAIFTVQASGDKLTYQWTVSKDGGKTWKNCTSTGYNTATLRFTAKTSYSGWQYSCLVTNHRCMVSTNAATLTVLPADTAPVILEGPADQTVTAGKKATFRVEAAGSGLTYQWQVNKTGTWKNCTSAGFDQPEFSFTAKTSYSGWKYRCVNDDAPDLFESFL